VHTDIAVSLLMAADVNSIFRDCYRATFSLNFNLFDDSNFDETDNDMFP